MRRILIQIGLLVMPILCLAQVSKQQAIETVMNTVINRDSVRVNVYVEPLLQTNEFYKLSPYDSISAPFSHYWLFFVDDKPEFGWGHDCRYVFVDHSDGTIRINNSQKPPIDYKLKLDVVLESVDMLSQDMNIISGVPNVNNYQSIGGKYALLFTGGESSGLRPTAFWNALCHSYCGLIENGYKKENIFVLSCDGDTLLPNTNYSLDFDKDGDPDIMNVPCSLTNIEKVIDTLSLVMQKGDVLYVFGTTHGYVDGDNTFLSLWEAEPLYDYELSDMLSRIDCSQLIVNLYACYSGGMVEEIINIPNDVKKTVLTCIGNYFVYRHVAFADYSGMDFYNYFINTAFRNYHPKYSDTIWEKKCLIGQLQDTSLFAFSVIPEHIDVNYDYFVNEGNNNGIHEIGEIIKYTSHFDPYRFGNSGCKHYDCGFKDDLLSLHGITGKVVTTDTVNGNFHIEDTLSVCAQSLTMEANTEFYLFDADLIVEDNSTLVMGDNTSIIARSGDCRVIVKGELALGNDVTFEARDGSTLKIVFDNDKDLFIENTKFINCSLVLPIKNITIQDCCFWGSPFVAEIPSSFRVDDYTVTLMDCVFVPNGNEISNAIYIKGYPHYFVNDCNIDALGDGSFANGISIYNSGCNNGVKQIENNVIKGCSSSGILVYSSSGDIILNKVERNGYGVKLLNNCNIGQFSGNYAATNENLTQFIHDNDFNEVYMTDNCIPERFRYNCIKDGDNIPFVYHDAYIGIGEIGAPSARAAIDVKKNNWGDNFAHSTHLFTNLSSGYEYLPYWDFVGTSVGEAESILSKADSLNGIGDYALAKSLYMQVVENFPNTVSAETALKTLLPLEKNVANDYDGLKVYYQCNQTISNNIVLKHLASSLANKCDVILENYDNAIAWYEKVLFDSETSFNDSIFAAIDLGDLYLVIGENKGVENIGPLEQYMPNSTAEHQIQKEYALSLLPIIKGTNDVYEVLPIRNLSAEVLADNNVSLAWDMPSGYESGTATIGWTRSDTIGDMWQYGFDSYMAHLYDAADLKNHNGWRINSVSFYKTTTWTYSACIWKQEEGGEMSLIHSQEIAGDLPMGINEVELDADIYIMPETKYWIGLRATYNAGQTGLYPFATDVDPMVKGKGMLGMGYGTSTWDDNTGYSIGNLWLKVEVESVEGGRSNAEDEMSGYRVYRNNQLIKEMRYAFVTYFTDDDFVRDVEAEYCVTAVYGESESERECATVTVPGVYEVLPVRNLSAEVLADNNVSLAWDMPSGYESGTATSNNELAGVYHFQKNVKESKGFGEDELSGYRVYRNNQLIKEITNTFETYFTDDDFVRDVEAEYCITAVYGESESERECATVTVPGVYEVLPVRNLSAEVSADNNVSLAWDMPSGYESGTATSNNELAGVYHFQKNVKESKGFGEDELSGYRVYRNNQLIKEITNTFETYFTDDDFVRDVEAEYCVTAVYGESESERECATVTVSGVYEVLPVRNLSAEVSADDKVTLSWDMPSVYESGTTTITWTGNDTVGDMFQYGWDSYMAQLYDAADLKNHNGWRINSVSFYKTTTWTYSACVWKQEEGGEMSLIHSQEIAGDLPMGINEVELDGDIYIMPETKYWIGLRATLNAGQTGVYPFATDGGTVVLGKGLLGMLPDGSEWGSDSFGSVVSGNLWLKVEVEKQESDKWNVELGGNALNAYRLYRNSQLIKEIPYSFVTYFTDDNFVRDVEAEYCVTAVYGEDESERECATVTINGVQEDSAQCGVTISPNPTYGIVNIDGIMVSEATVYNALGQIIVKVFNTNVLTIEGARRGVYSMSLKDIDGNIITKKIVLK